MKKNRDRKKRYNIKVKGSYTIEAALVMPIVLFCLLFVMEQAINLYMETVEITSEQEKWEAFKPSKTFRSMELVGEIID